jgi:hypothetical protein
MLAVSNTLNLSFHILMSDVAGDNTIAPGIESLTS